MTVENQSDIDGILAAGRIVAMVRDAMLSKVEPGMTTADLIAVTGVDCGWVKSLPLSLSCPPRAAT